MKQIITMDQLEIEDSIKKHLEKYVTAGYGKTLEITFIKFETKDEKILCTIDIDIVDKEKS